MYYLLMTHFIKFSLDHHIVALLFKVHLVYTTLSKNMNPMEDNLPPEDKLIDDIRECNHREFAYEDFSGRVIVRARR